jgi:hypothetical protein
LINRKENAGPLTSASDAHRLLDHQLDQKNYVRALKLNAVLGVDSNPPLKRTRVALAEMPTLMMDMIESILSTDPEIEVVARLAMVADLQTWVQSHKADVLIIGRVVARLAESAPTEAFSWSPRKVITVADTAKYATEWIMRPDGVPLGELSAESLLASVSDTAGHAS